MGNSPCLLGNGNYSYDIKLGKAATISVTKDECILGPRWQLVYNVDEMTSELYILKITDKKSSLDKLHINVLDCAVKKELLSIRAYPCEVITVEVIKEKTNGLLCSSYMLKNNLRSAAEYGESFSGAVKTERWVYACGTRKGLLVLENKKKNNEKQSYMVTVAHYYVNSSTGGSGVDIGFSVMVKIGVVNGQLDFIVDGPIEHPISALVYMIEEVSRTGKWKPSACPHCKNIQSQQRRFLLSESEDSDRNLPTPPSHAGQQNTSNMGYFSGDGIGSMIRAYKVNFNKWCIY